MLLPEELYSSLPRKVPLWSPEDVKLWFQLQSVATDPLFNFVQQRLDGPAFLAVTPQYLHEECGITSNILIKKIVEWLEQDRQEFEEYVGSQPCPASIQSSAEGPTSSVLQFPLQDQEDVSERKGICRHLEAITPIENVKKWNLGRKKAQSQEELVPEVSSPCREGTGSMKYIQSSYEVCEHLLLLEYGGVTVTLKHSGNVGRNNNCEVLVNEASVSREHALITRLNNQYFLQDVGSKYGTFVETGLDCTRPLQEGDFLAFNDSYLEILTFRVYSQNGKECFDLKAKLYKQDNAIGATFHSQQSLFIGRANKDITFNFPQIAGSHAKIVIHGHRLYCLKQDGLCFLKLKREQVYELEDRQFVRFGLMQAYVTLQRKSKPLLNVGSLLQEKQC